MTNLAREIQRALQTILMKFKQLLEITFVHTEKNQFIGSTASEPLNNDLWQYYLIMDVL